ncbi:hypothetical protein LIER_35755 [Lithospermum erythrorhizon]|uniref:Uncharacterized protein n=1 Tax=Lithospermum erythrorhizon TaxID=34254 RepID=A0AAV3NVU6_LITER
MSSRRGDLSFDYHEIILVDFMQDLRKILVNFQQEVEEDEYYGAPIYDLEKEEETFDDEEESPTYDSYGGGDNNLFGWEIDVFEEDSIIPKNGFKDLNGEYGEAQAKLQGAISDDELINRLVFNKVDLY